MQAQSILPPPTRFFVIIPRDIRDRLVPKQSEAFGLYTQLADAVTCEVPHGDKKFGLVLGGKSMSQVEWAKRFRMTRRSFQRALAVLKSENLVVVHRGQHDTRIAVTDSVKKMRRVTIEHYPWLLGLPDAPNMAQLNTEPDAPEMAQQCANMAQLGANMAQLDAGKNAQVLDNALSCSEGDVREYRVEEKVEESGAKAKSSPPSLNPESTPTPTPTPTEIDEICAKLYLIGKTSNQFQPTFPGKYRAGIGDLLAAYSADELYEAYAEFVKSLDDFQMRNAPKHFAEGAVDVLTAVRERKRVAAEQLRERDDLLKQWRQREIANHRTAVERKVLEEQEQWGREYPPSDELHQRYRLARETTGCYGFERLEERIALDKLRAEAAKTPTVQNAVNERLAAEPPFEPGQCRLTNSQLRMEFGSDAAKLTVAAELAKPQSSHSQQKMPTFDALEAFRAQK